MTSLDTFVSLAPPISVSCNSNIRRHQTLFPQLPPELRLRIWDLNLPTSRFVTIRCGSDNLDSPVADVPHNNDPTWWTNSSVLCTSPAPVPANLHTCAESRAHALTKYRLSFSYAQQEPRIYFNPNTDVVYFGPRPGYMASNAQFHTFMTLTPPAELAVIKRIAIDDALFWTHDTKYWSMLAVSLTTECLKQIHRRMPSLEEIVFVPHQSTWTNDADLVQKMLADQVMTAMQDYSRQIEGMVTPSWTWSILRRPLSLPDHMAGPLREWCVRPEKDQFGQPVQAPQIWAV